MRPDDPLEEASPPSETDSLLIPERRSTAENLDEIVRTVKEVAAKTADTISAAIDRALTVPDAFRHSVILRLDDETLAKIDSLVESGVSARREDASLFLISEGIKRQSALFEGIQSKMTEIEHLKLEMRELAEKERQA